MKKKVDKIFRFLTVAGIVCLGLCPFLMFFNNDLAQKAGVIAFLFLLLATMFSKFREGD
jgi:hypothetical protein